MQSAKFCAKSCGSACRDDEVETQPPANHRDVIGSFEIGCLLLETSDTFFRDRSRSYSHPVGQKMHTPRLSVFCISAALCLSKRIMALAPNDRARQVHPAASSASGQRACGSSYSWGRPPSPHNLVSSKPRLRSAKARSAQGDTVSY